jgi:anti-anti-sigma factor
MRHEFEISHREENDWTIVEIRGEADMYTAPQIREHVFDRIRSGHHRLILDLLGVRFMDSTGLGALVGIRNLIAPRGGELRLAISHPGIRRIFAITGLHQVFPIYDSVDLAKVAR